MIESLIHKYTRKSVPLLVTKQLHELRLVTARLKFVQNLSETLFTHVRQGFRRQLGIRRRAASLWRPSEGMGRIWADTERDFKIEARRIRVALDALHDLCSRKTATKQLFKAMTDAGLRAHYGRLEAERRSPRGLWG